MQRPDTTDGLFHDGDPTTGVKGTPITSAWLNALISVGAFLSGSTEPPASELGGPGDYYLCKTSHKMYGPKDQDTGWPAGYTSLIGPEGPQGVTGNPYKSYTTLAAANADLANIPADALIWINSDTTPANIGYWIKTGGVLIQSSYDRVGALESGSSTATILNGLTMVTNDTQIVIDMTAKTIVGGGGLLLHKNGYTAIPANQNVAFAYTSATAIMFLYADRSNGTLGISYLAAPPVNCMVLGYLYNQKLFAHDPACRIRVIPTTYASGISTMADYQALFTGDEGCITINLSTKKITTDAIGGRAFWRGGNVVIPANQDVTFALTVMTGSAYLFAHPTTGALYITDGGATPPAGFPLLGIINNQQFYSLSSAKCFKIVNTANKTYRGHGLSNGYETPLAVVSAGSSIVIDLQANTLTTGSSANATVMFDGGYKQIAANQAVGFATGSADYLIYICVNKSTGALSAFPVTSGYPPPGVVVIAMTFGQKLYAHDPYGTITLIDANGAEVSAPATATSEGFGTIADTVNGNLNITVNLQTKLITTSGTPPNGVIYHNSGYVSVATDQSVSFVHTLPSYPLWLYINRTTGVVGAVQLQATFPPDCVAFGVIYDQIAYVNDPLNRFVLYDVNGAKVVQNSTSEIFDDTVQRLILPTDMYFLPNTPLSMFKAPCFSDYNAVIMDQIKMWLDTKSAMAKNRFQPVNQLISLDPTILNNTFEIGFRHDSAPNVRYIQPITKHVAGTGALSGRSLKMLVFGDSLTEDQMATAFKNHLEAQGATITPVGTYFSSLTNNLRGEGRGYWSYRSFVGKDNYSAGVGAHTRGIGGATDTSKFENPFLKPASAADLANHPNWCFRFTGSDKELSYADDPVKTGDFYIFDFAWYMVQYSVPAPDFITIALSTNDINLDTSSYTQAERLQFMRLGLEIMIKQIKAALPNVVIGIIPAPAWSSTVTGDPRYKNEVSFWIENCMTDVRTLQATYNNLYVVPVWPFISEDFCFPYATSTELSSTNKTLKKTITDWVHIEATGRLLYAEVVGAWVANVV